MRSPIAKEGFIFIIPLAVMAAAFYSFSYFWVTGLFGGLLNNLALLVYKFDLRIEIFTTRVAIEASDGSGALAE